jgi:hypothetical protein
LSPSKAQAALSVAEDILSAPVADRPNWTLPRLASEIERRRPTGDPQEILAKQKDYAKKAFELTVQNTRDLANLTKKTTSDASIATSLGR